MAAPSSSSSACLLLLFSTFSALIQYCSGRCFTSIFSFGDSLADTGNGIRISPLLEPPNYAFPPYGETYFGRPTGRCSDGRLVIDFIGQYLGLPLVQPYASGRDQSENYEKFQKGVNFAVAGACALDSEVLKEKGIDIPVTNVSLGTQLGWFKEILPSLCHTPSECKKLLRNALFVMGEIGGNDYNNPLLAGRTIEEVQSFVPPVIDAIASAIKDLIEIGAVTIMVPGNLPIGCLPSYLSRFASTSNSENYDPKTGCLIWLNEFAEYHNEMLRTELNQIQELHPRATVIYADYYNVAMAIYRDPIRYGKFCSNHTYASTISTITSPEHQLWYKPSWNILSVGFSGGALTACCGAGGGYNVDLSVSCGFPPTRACEDPSSYVSWDGLHLTEAAYSWISKGLLQGPYTVPPLNTLCLSLPVAGTDQFTS